MSKLTLSHEAQNSISELAKRELASMPDEVLPILEARSIELSDGVGKKMTKDFLCDGDLIDDIMYVESTIYGVYTKIMSLDEFTLKVEDFLFFKECARLLAEIRDRLTRIPDTNRERRNIATRKKTFDYELIVNEINANPDAQVSEFAKTCNSMNSYQNQRQTTIADVQNTIEQTCALALRQINQIMSECFPADKMVSAIENGAKSYFASARSKETNKLKKQASRLSKARKTKLATEDWLDMKMAEEKAMYLAAKGKMVCQNDEDSLNYLKDDERHTMEKNGALADQIADRFQDDQLFDFNELKDGSNGYISSLNYYNLTLLYKMVLRGNIIRCNIYPELQPKSDDWMSGKAEVKEEKTTTVWQKMQTAGFLQADEMPVTRNIEEMGVLAYTIAEVEQIPNVWKFFSTKWKVKSESLRKGHDRRKVKDDYNELRAKFLKTMRA